MLKKSLRLNLKHSFKAVVTQSKRIETPHFKLFVQKTVENFPSLVGIALTKKEFRKAHERNKARRLTSLAIEAHYSRLNNGMNLVMMPKALVTQTSLQELKDEIGTIKYLYSTD